MPRLITLFRPVNLLLIALIQVIIQFRVIIPLVETNDVFTIGQFALIVCITILAGASGYVINDIYDVQIDSRNKPGKNLVGTTLTLRTTKAIYWSLVISGLILTSALGTDYRIQGIVFYVFSVAILYAYSAWFKKSPLIGNLIVSAFAAMVVYVLWMGQNLIWDGSQNGTVGFDLVLMYSVFAFVSTLIREIVKDIEDMQGDASAGARTLPLLVGVKKSGMICETLAIMLGLGLIYWLRQIAPILSDLARWYFILAVLLPVLGIALLVFRSKTKQDWHRVSQFIKVVILLGTLFLLLI